jgi:predicted CXXCH cytochrome family protein
MNKGLISTIAATASMASFSLLLLHTSVAQKNYQEWNIASFAKYKTIAGAARAGVNTCTTCHSEIVSAANHAYHAQQGVECEDCHGNGSLHVEGGGDVSKIISYRRRSAREANGACLSCHAQDERVRHWMTGKHSSNGVRCIDCHQTHSQAFRAVNENRISFDTATRAALTAGLVSPETNVIVRRPSAANEACLKCHPSQRAQLSMPYHHPLREGKMDCADCHDPHGGAGGNNLRSANANQLCLTCHAQYRGPFAYQHPPVTENCMLCHTPHGSPNPKLLTVSAPALCLQCHTGHHNGAGLPLPDRCINCHVSIHGTDTPTPSGGTRFVDKGPSDPALRGTAGLAPASLTRPRAAVANSAVARAASAQTSAFRASGASGALGILGMLSSGFAAPFSGGDVPQVSSPASAEAAGSSSFYSITPGVYRFVDGSGFLGRVGEYDSLQESAGTDAEAAYVLPLKHLTVVSHANVLTGDDYNGAFQLTAGDRLRIGLAMRSFEQQQDNRPFYAFPVLDVPPGVTTPPDSTTDLIPPATTFAVVRRIGKAYARLKAPKLPVHLFVKGDWNARAGVSQLSYLDENTTAAVVVGGVNTTCGQQCHHISQLQGLNFTTRNIGGGADVKVGQMLLRYEHDFSSFNDRLTFPTGTFTGPFTPENEGISSANPPPSGPAPADIPAGNYFLNIPAPSQSSSDSVSINWTLTPELIVNGEVSYTRLRDTFTRYPQNAFNSDTTLNWHALDRLQVTGDYHQQNLLNNFTPYYSLYGNMSYHRHWEGVRFDYELPKGLDVEVRYQRNGISRSNTFLWPQIYSINNTDLLTVVPASFSNTTGLALRYHDRSGYWSARAGYEWTGTHQPGYLVEPRSNNRVFADVWLTPKPWLLLSNDTSIIVQNAFPAISLLRADGTGLPGDFERRNRFYINTLSVALRYVPGWDLGLGYSYQQNNLTTYMAFQNDSGVGYVVDEAAVPYKQITQAYWGESTYTFRKRLGLNLRITYNSSRSGMRPDVNPNDAAQLGNGPLISEGAFDPGGLFPSALGNVQFGAAQVSEVIVPEWIGQGKGYYLFPHKFEGGLVLYYGSYRDVFNPNLNGVLRTFSVYVGRSW